MYLFQNTNNVIYWEMNTLLKPECWSPENVAALILINIAKT